MPAPPPRRIVQALLGTPKGGRLPAGLLGSQGSMSSYTPTARERLTALIAKGLLGDTREGFRKAGKVTDIAEMSPVGLLTGMYDAGRAAGGGNMMQAGLIGGMAALPLPPAIKKGIRAYHGSPHSFDKFDMSKIGTGEGAQAYGHGLYFAEGEGTAKAYRDQLSDARYKINGKEVGGKTQSAKGTMTEHAAANALWRFNGNKEAAIQNLLEYGDTSAAKLLKSADVEEIPGHMYEVNIDADPDQFLDWDKPLSGQSEAARNKLLPVIDSHGIKTSGEAVNGNQWELNGGEIYDRIATVQRGPGAHRNISTGVLQEAGIPGIKYLDAGSRAKGDGSRNYVVFDEKLISIVRKYGIAGASTLLGYDLLSNVTTDQAEKLKQAERVY